MARNLAAAARIRSVIGPLSIDLLKLGTSVVFDFAGNTVADRRYSSRSATTGSTFAARRAGSQTPRNATAVSSAGTMVNTSGSRAVTPNRNDAITRLRPK